MNEIGPVELRITPAVVRAYAEVARDFNPIHFDDDAAKRVGLPAPSAHGMISGALLSRILAAAFGELWLRGGELSIKFVRPVLVGETVRARATERPATTEVFDVRVVNDDGLPVIVGTARLRNPRN